MTQGRNRLGYGAKTSFPRIRVLRKAEFPAPVEQGFDLVAALENWPLFVPNFVRFADRAPRRWASPGDESAIVLSQTGAQHIVRVRLVEWLEPRRLVYESTMAELPAARHEFHFRATSRGFAMTYGIEVAPRSGLSGLVDRSLIKIAATRAVDGTIEALTERFRPPLQGQEP